MNNPVFLIRSKSGSILIWSVMLGFILTSVFFFFSMRQRATIAIQQDTADILNKRQYLESYADYIQSLLLAELDKLKLSGIDYDGISGTVTNEVNEITGVADVDYQTKPISIEYNFGGNIFIEWNKCTGNLKGGLYVNEVLYEHDKVSECSPPPVSGYDDLIGPITVTSPFKIKTLNAPFAYHITPKDASTHLIDNKWQLDIKSELDYGKKVEVKRYFKAK